MLKLAGLIVGLAALVIRTLGYRGASRFPLAGLFRDSYRWPRLTLLHISIGLTAGVLVVLWPLSFGTRLEHVDGTWPARASLLAAVTILVKAAYVVFEELIYRGALLPLIRARAGTHAAVVFTALAFAAAHGRGTSSFVVLFIDGLAFAIAAVMTRSLWAPTAWHLGKNLAVWIFFDAGSLQFVTGLFRATPATAVDTPSDIVATTLISACALLSMSVVSRHGAAHP